jgi:hypothetical protein
VNSARMMNFIDYQPSYCGSKTLNTPKSWIKFTSLPIMHEHEKFLGEYAANCYTGCLTVAN